MTAPYKATPMKPINLKNGAERGEMSFDMATPAAVKSTIPAKADAKASMMDGPYGGKKPA
jgi:hypothetical protein